MATKLPGQTWCKSSHLVHSSVDLLLRKLPPLVVVAVQRTGGLTRDIFNVRYCRMRTEPANYLALAREVKGRSAVNGRSRELRFGTLHEQAVEFGQPLILIG